jgi:hypothetical protein
MKQNYLRQARTELSDAVLNHLLKQTGTASQNDGFQVILLLLNTCRYTRFSITKQKKAAILYPGENTSALYCG